MYNIKSLEKENREFHIPGYNFCGPGTKVFTRLIRGDKGINKLDEACKCHDIEYLMHAGDDKSLAESDDRLRKAAKIVGGISASLVDKVFLMKRILENLNIITPTGFAKKLAKKISIKDQRKLGRLLYKRYILNNKNISLDEYY